MARRRDHDGHDRCWYCEQVLSPRHEHDHIPPKSVGGVRTVPTCINCHDLKDRSSLADWAAEDVMAALLTIPPGLGRVLVAKLHAIGMRGVAALDDLELQQ